MVVKHTTEAFDPGTESSLFFVLASYRRCDRSRRGHGCGLSKGPDLQVKRQC